MLIQTIEVGITLKIPGTDYGMAKPIVRMDFDIDGDIDEQIERHKKAMEKTGPAVEEATAQELANTTGIASEGYGLADEVAKLAKTLGFVVKEMKRQKEVVGKLAPKGRSGARKAKE